MSFSSITKLVYIFLIVIIFVFRLLYPKFTHKDFFFGVNVSNEPGDSDKFRKIKAAYYRDYLLICGIYTLLFCIALTVYEENIVFFGGLAIYFALSIMVYYIAHRKAMKLKSIKSKKDRKNVVVVDTSFRNDNKKKLLPSKLWFLIPLAIITINILVGFKCFDNLPVVVPLNWGADGRVNGAAFKSIGIVFLIPVEQIFITVFTYLFYKAIGRSKQHISVNEPKKSRDRSRIFRFRYAACAIFFDLIFTVYYTFENLFLLQLIKVNPLYFTFDITKMIIVIILFNIFIGFWIGQDGNNIDIDDKYEENNFAGNFDDRYWPGGLVYFNRKDPAIFVEKRCGIGWGFNYGRVETYLLILCFIVSLFAENIFLEILVRV